MNKVRIAGFIDSSMVDGPGNRSVVFFQGCNFNCFYCHNPETISLSGGSLVDIPDILSRIKNNMPFIDGITVSGGECTLQIDSLIKLFYSTKKLGLTNFVDTNGSILIKSTELIESTDRFILDVKACDAVAHKKITGQENYNVIINAEYLFKIKKLYELRTVVYGDILEAENTIKLMGQLLSPLGDIRSISYKLIRLRNFNHIAKEIEFKVPTIEHMSSLKRLANNLGFSNVTIS